jgi:ATP-dependent helicase HrpA
VDEDAQAALYAERVPAHVHSRATFEAWRREAEAKEPNVLHFTREAVMRHAATHVTEALFPATLAMGGAKLALDYRFAPGHPRDGLTLTVPLALLNQLDEGRLTWLVPGLVREKITLYLKGLPKALRNRLIPLPDTVTAFLEAVPFGADALPAALRGWLRNRLGETVDAAVLDAVELPPYLRMNVRVVDAAGAGLGEGRDTVELRARLGEAAQLSFAAAGPGFERSGLASWDFGELPESLAVVRKGQRLTGYPALVDEGDTVALRLLDTRDAAQAATRAGVLRLMRRALKDALSRYEKGPPGFQQTALQLRAVVPPDRLQEDVLAAIVDRAFLGDDPLPRDADAFAAQVKRARTRLPAVADGALRLLAAIAAAHASLSQRLGAAPPGLGRLTAELRAQRDALVYPGFFAGTPWAQLNHVPRYLQALERRLAKYPANPDRDARHAAQVMLWWTKYKEQRERDRAAGRSDARLEEFRWLLEELRVSLFAQELRTPQPVSFKRVEKAWAALQD